MSLNYNLIDTLKLLKDAFKYDIFLAIILGVILMTIALIINKERKIINYIILCINLLLITLISYFYIDNIITLNFSNDINNMYFYFLSTIVYLVIMTVMSFISKYKKINYIFYGISLIGILYSLFITHYLGNIDIIVIGNIFPMIKFGNILYIVYYILLITIGVSFLWKKK